MTRVPASITPKSISIFFEGRMRIIPSSHINFLRVRKVLTDIDKMHSAPELGFVARQLYGTRDQRIEKAVSKLRDLLDIPAYITRLTEGLVKVTDKGVLYADQPVHNLVAERIMQHLHQGLDVAPLAKFMNKIMLNPKTDIGAELFEWMEGAQLPITSEGNLIAFKKVAGDYTSIHQGPGGTKISNAPGLVVKMERAAVDSDRDRECSNGLHFCGFEYLSHYGSGGENKVVVVEIDPMNVCAIPRDYNYQKGRACEYKVIGEVPQEECKDFFKGTPLITGGTVGISAFQAPETTHTIVMDDEFNDDYGPVPEPMMILDDPVSRSPLPTEGMKPLYDLGGGFETELATETPANSAEQLDEKDYEDYQDYEDDCSDCGEYIDECTCYDADTEDAQAAADRIEAEFVAAEVREEVERRDEADALAAKEIAENLAIEDARQAEAREYKQRAIEAEAKRIAEERYQEELQRLGHEEDERAVEEFRIQLRQKRENPAADYDHDDPNIDTWGI